MIVKNIKLVSIKNLLLVGMIFVASNTQAGWGWHAFCDKATSFLTNNRSSVQLSAALIASVVTVAVFCHIKWSEKQKKVNAQEKTNTSAPIITDFKALKFTYKSSENGCVTYIYNDLIKIYNNFSTYSLYKKFGDNLFLILDGAADIICFCSQSQPNRIMVLSNDFDSNLNIIMEVELDSTGNYKVLGTLNLDKSINVNLNQIINISSNRVELTLHMHDRSEIKINIAEQSKRRQV